MTAVAAPPPPSIPSAEPARTSRLARMTPRRFRLLLLAAFSLSAVLASEGLQRIAAMRTNYYTGTIRARAVSPIAYRASLPGLHALASSGAGVRAVVRADSAGEAGAELCALGSTLANDPGVAWVVFSDEVEGCLSAPVRGRIVRASAAARQEMGRARWVLLARDGTALHSGRQVPHATEVRQTAALFTPAGL